MKKIFKGWMGKSIKIERAIQWWEDDPGDYVLEAYFVRRKRRGKADWYENDWPPKRVTVTVEVGGND